MQRSEHGFKLGDVFGAKFRSRHKKAIGYNGLALAARFQNLIKYCIQKEDFAWMDHEYSEHTTRANFG